MVVDLGPDQVFAKILDRDLTLEKQPGFISESHLIFTKESLHFTIFF